MADNKTIRKIFSLSDYRKKQLVGEIVERTRETYREYGYFGGGTIPGVDVTPIVNRIDYSNDTSIASVRGPLTSSRGYYPGSAGNSNFGYFSGGYTFGAGDRSTIDRVNYSNDNIQASSRGILSLARRFLSATGNSNFGYFGGGYRSGARSVVDRVDYYNDTSIASVRGSLSLARVSLAATGNSNFGYFGGGNPGATARVDRINYSNDTAIASVRSPLSSVRYSFAATGNSNFGYFGGGAQAISIVERINYSNDLATISPRGPLALSRSNLSATGNSNFGYFSGGSDQTPSSRTNFSQTQRIDYSNDTVTTTTKGNLSSVRSYMGATSSHSFGGTPNSSFASNFTFPTVPNAGYFGGGTDGTNNLAGIDKVDYANDTATASVRSALSLAKKEMSAVGNSSFGYFSGGDSPQTDVYRLEYSSDTQNTTVRGPLQIGSASRSAVGNQSYGYVNGGSAINRIDYSNDSSTLNRGNLLNSSVLYYWSSISSPYYGYFTGGYSSPTTYSGLDRIDFANDTLTASKRTNVPNISYGMSGFGNQSFGYIGGGINVTYVRRVDYANDTANISFRGPLSRNINYLSSATSNSNFGYFGGGIAPSSPITSQVDRINFSNDTAIASVRGSLSTAKSALAATSPLAYGGAPIYFTNPLPEVFQKQITFNDSNTLDLPFKRVLGSFGYFGGGNPVRTLVERIDYSNDLAQASIRGPLSASNKYLIASVGNSNFGYYAGGVFTGSIDRIDYSNDSVVSLLKGSLTILSYRFSGTGNNNFGYFGGSQGTSIVDRTDYSNDSTTAVSRGPLSLSRRHTGATGNSNFGYFGGGGTPTSVSIVDRIDYSNDTTTASVRGPLSTAKDYPCASGNSNFGYFSVGGLTDRINYSNDTVNVSVRGSFGGGYRTATGNSNFGYTSLTSSSQISRIDYNNDLAISSNRGNISQSRNTYGATTNASNS